MAPEERAALAEKEAAEAWKETRGAETVDVDEWDTGGRSVPPGTNGEVQGVSCQLVNLIPQIGSKVRV